MKRSCSSFAALLTGKTGSAAFFVLAILGFEVGLVVNFKVSFLGRSCSQVEWGSSLGFAVEALLVSAGETSS